MAVLDELQRMEQQVAKRLRDLEPLVSEYNELRKVAERLGISPADGQATPRPGRRSRRSVAKGRGAGTVAGGAKTKPATARRVSKGRTARSRRNAAAPGSRQQDVLRVVSDLHS